MLDYIIVGFGIAGINFARILEKNNKSFVIFDDNSQCATKVASGLYNPIFIRYLKKVWQSEQCIAALNSFIKDFENDFSSRIASQIDIYKILKTENQLKEWKKKTRKLQPYLSDQIEDCKNYQIKAPFGLGVITQSGQVNVKKLREIYTQHLEGKNCLITSHFNYDKIKIEGDAISYEDFISNKIVFSEGRGLLNNPYFNNLPLKGSKGEWLIIKALGIDTQHIIQSSLFVIPLGDNTYKIGATYNNEDLDTKTSDEAREEIEKKLRTFYTGQYTILDQGAGIRPTTSHRRAMLGSHSTSKNFYVFNGLGSRGILTSSYLANMLYRYIEYQEPLLEDVDIRNLNY